MNTTAHLLLTQVVAYVLSSYILLPSMFPDNESNKYLFKKSAIFFLASWILANELCFWPVALALTLMIYGISSLPNTKIKNYSFIVKQVAQLAVISLAVCIYKKYWPGLASLRIFISSLLHQKNFLRYALTYLLCLGPTNVLIRFLLTSYNLVPNIADKNDSLVKAGRFIGNVERVITLSLVLMGKFEAIGFFIAAKSLLRLKDDQKKYSEYILAGTLLSFGIAIITGLILLQFVK